MLYIVSLFINVISLGLKKIRYIAIFLGFSVFVYLASTVKSSYSYDTSSYEFWYTVEGGQGNRFEPGYQFLASWAYNHGFSYEDFRYIFFIIVYIILFIALVRLKANIPLFLLLYSLFPFTNEATTVRSTMMISFVFLGISFLGSEIRSNVIALICIIIGAQFHSSGYYFLLLLILNRVPIKKYIKISKFVVPFVFLMTPVMLFIGPTISRFQTKLFSLVNRSTIYANYSKPSFADELQALGMSLAVIGVVIVILIILRSINEDVLLEDMQLQNLVRFIFVTVLFVPLMFYSFGFERIIRFGIIGLWILISKMTDKKMEFNKYYISSIIIYILLILLAVFFSKGYFRFSPGTWGYFNQYILHFKSTI